MTFTKTCASLLCLGLATPALAEPYCADLLNADALESRYQRLAPIYSSQDTGWIFASDQLRYRYVLNATEEMLLADLVAELEARGTQLAMLIAPPRPVVAGQAVLDATAGGDADHDVAAHAAAFTEMLAQIGAAGAVAPNLLELALSDATLAEAYYFQRDTHWTNLGAAHSALALADALTPGSEPAFDAAALVPVEPYEERGSLSQIVDATCGAAPAPELGQLFDYAPYLSHRGGLLGEVEGTPAILLGTSFSDRYGRDQYQSAEALAAALQRPVENRSVSGGGMIGPFEAYILSGDFVADAPDLIIWEFPYTYQLTEAALRQLLGALRADGATVTAATAPLSDSVAEMVLTEAAGATDRIGVRLIGGTARDLVVTLTMADGVEHRLRLRRKSRMEEVAVFNDWWIDLRGFDARLSAISIEVRGNTDAQEVALMVGAVSG